jgi:hypothetical protein
MVCDVVRFRIVVEQRRALFKIGSDNERSWLSRPMDSEAHHKPLAELECRRTVHRALLQVRELAP